MTHKDLAEEQYNEGLCNTLRATFPESFLDSLLEECGGRTEGVVSFLDSLFYTLNRNTEADWLEQKQKEQDLLDWNETHEARMYN